ncbi:hypothetical protein GCM10011506_38070 [Marivirga lumbricoides]|uniref:RHS repeat-associated core domain-containing protein n=1 Tax=Marivirga lumbricoides TaxID=1046115 RepID=A0ABQ1N4K0_9BACT|nr:hypothetical protein GCM10011506_38070 [Marivirga lumbricoides]
MLGLGVRAFNLHTRIYDPALGRFWQVDPMADARNWFTPYNFVQNNPITGVDPTGMLDIYALDKESGNINLIKETADATDQLVDNQTGETIVDEVDKGLLSDGQNIKTDGMQTSNVMGGMKLALGISMHTSEEVGGAIYENSEGGRMLNVLPYEGQRLETNSNGKVTAMHAAFKLELKSSFTSNDGSFTGRPIAAFHTHPGHPNAAASATYLGTPRPSGEDLIIGLNNKKYNNVIVPYFIYGKKQMNYEGVTSNTSQYRPQADGGIPWTLRSRSWKK